MKAPDPFISASSCLVIFLGYLLFSYGSLPTHMASHFNMQGHANGWMSRKTYLELMSATGIFLPIFVSLMMVSVTRLPSKYVNLPNRDYWLTPERLGSTSALLFRYALWFSSLNLLFLTGIAWLVAQANAPGSEHRLSGLGLALIVGGFLLGTGVWVASLKRRFSILAKPPYPSS